VLQSNALTNANTLVRTAAILALGNYDAASNFLASLWRADWPTEEMRALELSMSKIRERAK
jgi:hypothetical protein